MNIDKFIFAFAGIMTLTGTVLGHYVNEFWLILPAFVGLNMFQAAFTGFCPLAMILKKLGFKQGNAF